MASIFCSSVSLSLRSSCQYPPRLGGSPAAAGRVASIARTAAHALTALRASRAWSERFGLPNAIIRVSPGEPDVPAPDTRLERLTARKVLLVVGTGVAAYVVLSQLSNVDLATLVDRLLP